MRSDVAPTEALYLTVNWRFELAPNRGVKVFVQHEVSGIIDTLPSTENENISAPAQHWGFLVSVVTLQLLFISNGLTAIMPRKKEKRKPNFGLPLFNLRGVFIVP